MVWEESHGRVGLSRVSFGSSLKVCCSFWCYFPHGLQSFVGWHCCEHSHIHFCPCIFVLSIDWATITLPVLSSAHSQALVHLLCLQLIISDSQLRKHGGVISLTVYRAGQWQGWTLTRSTSPQAQVPSHQQLSPSPSIFSTNLCQLCRAPSTTAPHTMGQISTEVSLLTWQILIVLPVHAKHFSSHK